MDVDVAAVVDGPAGVLPRSRSSAGSDAAHIRATGQPARRPGGGRRPAHRPGREQDEPPTPIRGRWTGSGHAGRASRRPSAQRPRQPIDPAVAALGRGLGPCRLRAGRGLGRRRARARPGLGRPGRGRRGGLRAGPGPDRGEPPPSASAQRDRQLRSAGTRDAIAATLGLERQAGLPAHRPSRRSPARRPTRPSAGSVSPVLAGRIREVGDAPPRRGSASSVMPPPGVRTAPGSARRSGARSGSRSPRSGRPCPRSLALGGVVEEWLDDVSQVDQVLRSERSAGLAVGDDLGSAPTPLTTRALHRHGLVGLERRDELGDPVVRAWDDEDVDQPVVGEHVIVRMRPVKMTVPSSTPAAVAAASSAARSSPSRTSRQRTRRPRGGARRSPR